MRSALAAVGAAALFLIGCSEKNETAAAASSADTTVIVPVVKASRMDLAGEIVLTGEFVPFQEIDVMAKVNGYVHSIPVDIGDRVNAGQTLATLESPEMQDEIDKATAAIDQVTAEMQTATDDVHRAESAHEMIHLSYTRVQNVAEKEKGLVPQQEVDEAHSRDLVAEAQVAAAKSNLRTLAERIRGARAEEKRLKTMHAYTVITAPFAGVITKRYANLGSMIQAGTSSQAMPLVRLSQNGLLRLTLPVPESAVPHVRTGSQVDVSVPTLSRTFRGKVTRSAEKVQSNTRTMDTEVDVPNPELTLVPGMYAEVRLRIEDRPNAIAVPPDSIERTADGARVLTVDSTKTIRAVPVTIGLETGTMVEIRSGIREDTLVVAGRRAGLKEGQVVNPKLSRPGQP